MATAPTWTSTFAPVCQHSFMNLDNSTDIDDLFLKKNEDVNIVKMLEMKGEILSLIQGKEEIELFEEEKEMIEKEGEKEETKKEVEQLLETIQTYIEKFTLLHSELNKCNDLFQKEVQLLQKNVSTTESMIEFIKKIPEEQKDQENMNLIIEQMGILSKSIMDNKKIKEIRKNYVEKRKEFEKILLFIKKLNNFNQCNICPVCFTNPVDHFLDPCGHSICKSCIKDHLSKKDGLDLYEIGRNDGAQCCFCRERIKTIRQLYFL
tara:strand:+ start:1710 stop:2498 length:789 start_codon:yes stop_codon:yes gene_type:complete